MATSKSLLSDFTVKAARLSQLYDAAVRAEKNGDISQACKLAVTALDTPTDWLPDGDGSSSFTERWMDLKSEDRLQSLRSFIRKYEEFKAFALEQRTVFQARPTAVSVTQKLRAVENIRRQLDELNDLYLNQDLNSSQFEHIFKLFGKDRSSSSRYESGYSSYGSSSSSSFTAAYFALQAMETVKTQIMSLFSAPQSKYRMVLDRVEKTIKDLRVITSGTTRVREVTFDCVQEVENSLRELETELSSSVQDPFDPNKVREEDFMRYSRESDYVRTKKPGVVLTAEEEALLTSGPLSLSTLNNQLLVPLVRYAEVLLSEVEKRIKALTGNQKEDGDRRELTSVRDTLQNFIKGAVISAGNGVKPPQLDEISKVLLGKRNDLLGDKSYSSRSSYSSSSSGRGADIGARGSESTVQGIFYRRIDKGRVFAYVRQLKNFKEAMEESQTKVHATNQLARLKTRVRELDSQFKTTREVTSSGASSGRPLPLLLVSRDTLPRAKVSALLGFSKSLKREGLAFVRAHARFVMHRHRDAQDYMNYWIAMKHVVTDGEILELLKEYEEERKKLVQGSRETFDHFRKILSEAYAIARSTGDDEIVLSDAQILEIENNFESMIDWFMDQDQRVDRMHLHGAPPFLETITDPHVLIIYALKVLRVLFAWAALKVAGNVFQDMYDDRVYAKDSNPPLPIIFIAIFIAVDIALSFGVIVILMILKYMFKTLDNAFPVDSHLLRAWSQDLVMSTIVIFVIAFIIGEIIRKKKYFRYKYEGDRGIRAMQQMVLYVYCIVMFIPFFRLAHG